MAPITKVFDRATMIQAAEEIAARVDASSRTLPRDSLDAHQLLRPDAAADLLAISPRTLGKWRAEARGPKVVRIAGLPRYRYCDLCEWIIGLSEE